MLTPSELGHLLNVGRDTILGWTAEYREHLSARAAPPAGQRRLFNSLDLRVMAFVAHHSDEDTDAEEIHDLLRAGAQNSEEWTRWAFENSPLFGDPPDDLSEDSYGAVFGGMASRRAADVARSYWAATQVLLDRCVRDPHELDFPALFLVRHAIKLYLKALLRNPPRGHDLEQLIAAVEAQYGGRVAPWIVARLRDFNRFDRLSDYFRYGEGELAPGEYWVDFDHLRTAMERIIEGFERALRQI